MNNQKPSIGRIVHFRAKEGDPCIAAIITEVDNETLVTLTLFHPRPSNSWAHVGLEGSNDLDTMMGSWHWPERV
jgi:hypothetical protein